ncbi:S8 family serine peptidase [Streptococcus sp. zg-JUN1979]|uniref:S8 family serine peptidase n=1 Tax=Streptococcus sp. zg-JUN1979 TaxID=3391450 RepID=UPI0039A4E06F
MKKRETFSLRKYKIGAVSVLLGAVFLFGASGVAADELEATTSPQVQTVTSTPSETLSDDLLSTPVETPNAVSEVTSSETILIGEQESPQADTEVLDVELSPLDDTSNSPIATTSSEEIGNIELSTPSVEESSYQGEARPQNKDSNAIITVPSVWDSGYKGEGTIVAVIDSGLDLEHDVLRLSDVSTAKYKSKEELEAAKAAAGIDYGEWFSDKVVFGYNYVDVNNVLKEEAKRSHGMHVTSIAAGNPSKPVSGQLMYGVAPEAQVMFMRVFSDIKTSTGAALYAKAIEDAVKLGADSINLSLGGANGSLVNTEDAVSAAIELARRSGVSVVIAAGNDGAFGSGHSNPSADNPDYGLVGSPSTARDAISVASYNNTTLGSKVISIIGLEDNADLNYGKSSFDNPEKSPVTFEVGKEYDYVYAGLGETSDFEGLDLTGKLALIKRGAIPFSEKVANAISAGAVGAVIFNNRPGEANISMQLDSSAIAIPSIFIPFEFGEALANNAYKIAFNNDTDIKPNPEAHKLSDFSSWGLTADGELKPDLAAPGGGIYAAINDNDYANMQGTSMASPHVAGAAVLVKQYLQKTYPTKSPQELEALVKALLMSTAKAHTNKETGAYTSPRQQGAGIIDTAAAISTGLYLTGDDDYSSITLGNVEDTFSFTVTLHNITNDDKTLNYNTQLTTDTVENGLITLAPRLLADIPGGSVTIKANSSTTLTLTVDASPFANELTTLMPNGYYLEGFVTFTDVIDGGERVSIPYVGFRGAFQNLPVLEEPIYHLLADGKGGFYFEPVENEAKALDISQDYTGLVTSSTELIYSTNKRTDLTLKTLGTFKNNDDVFVLELDAEGKPYLAISPNGDNNQDSLAFKGVFLRNYTDLVASVYAADDKEYKRPLWTSQVQSGEKNYYSGDANNPKSSILFPTEWRGTDKDGKPLADGRYRYVLTYTSDVPGADVQRMSFDVVIDREAPLITTATYDDTNFSFKPRQAIDKGESGIFREQVFYLVADDNGLTTLITTTDTGDVVVSDHKIFVAQNEDGSFTLPLNLADLSQFYYTVEDYAGNISYEKVANLISIGQDKGLVNVSIKDVDTNEPAPIIFAYSVKDDKGNLVSDLPRYTDDSILKLPFGTYTFDLFLYDEEWSKLVSDRQVRVTISEENSVAEVVFYVQLQDKANLLIDIDSVPTGSILQLKSEDGKIITLPQAKYSKTDYGKLITLGNYTLIATLPEGYEFLEALDVSVLANQSNRKKLTLIRKVALIHLLKELVSIERTAQYYNADVSLQEAYIKALNEAKAISESKHDQATIDLATANLINAKSQLNGQMTDKTALASELADELKTKDHFSYYNANSNQQIAYDTSIRLAQLILAKDMVTQAEVDTALTHLQATKASLDGQKTDFAALHHLVSASETLIHTDAKYINASELARQTYEHALTLAKAVLSDDKASQAKVDEVLEALANAKDNLDGKPSPSGTDIDVIDTQVHKTEDKSISPPSTKKKNLYKESFKKSLVFEEKDKKSSSSFDQEGLSVTWQLPITAQQIAPTLKQTPSKHYLPQTGSDDEKLLVTLGIILYLTSVMIYLTSKKQV